MTSSLSNEANSVDSGSLLGVLGPEGQEQMVKLYSKELPALFNLDNREDQLSVLITKIQMCCYAFDMANVKAFPDEKETKRTTLLELVNFISTEQGIYREDVLREFMRMIRLNLFRALPPSRYQN